MSKTVVLDGVELVTIPVADRLPKPPVPFNREQFVDWMPWQREKVKDTDLWLFSRVGAAEKREKMVALVRFLALKYEKRAGGYTSVDANRALERFVVTTNILASTMMRLAAETRRSAMIVGAPAPAWLEEELLKDIEAGNVPKVVPEGEAFVLEFPDAAAARLPPPGEDDGDDRYDDLIGGNR